MLIDKPYYDYDYEYAEPKKAQRVLTDDERKKSLTSRFGLKLRGEQKPKDDLARAEELQKEAMQAIAEQKKR